MALHLRHGLPKNGPFLRGSRRGRGGRAPNKGSDQTEGNPNITVDFVDLGDGYASAQDGAVLFHGKQVDGVTTLGQVEIIGGGYAKVGNGIMYMGKPLPGGPE